MADASLYERLGGYDGIAAVADDFLPRVQADDRLGRFWLNRGADGIAREKQLLVDFLSSAAGGPMLYTGRDMTTTHKGMAISEDDWSRMVGHLTQALEKIQVPETEKAEVLAFIDSTKAEIVE